MNTTTTHIKQPAKSAITREYVLIKIEGSRKALLPEEIISSARENFQCRSVVIAEKKRKKEGQKSLDYLVGLHTKDASKNTYKKRSMKMFTEIYNFTLLDPSARKGIGGWARALCSDEFGIVSCSGELDTKTLEHIALQSKRKRGCFITNKKKEGYKKKKDEDCKNSFFLLPPSSLNKNKILPLLLKMLKILLLMLVKMLKTLLLMLVKMLKTLLLMLLKSIINTLVMTTVSRIILLFVSFGFFLYVFYYKGGAHITPEIIQRQTLGDIIDWLSDWKTGGLPEKFTKVERSVPSIIKDYLTSILSVVTYVNSYILNVKRLFNETKQFLDWVSKFFR